MFYKAGSFLSCIKPAGRTFKVIRRLLRYTQAQVQANGFASRNQLSESIVSRQSPT